MAVPSSEHGFWEMKKGKLLMSLPLLILRLFGFAGTLFTVALARQSFLGALLFTWFQVKRVALDFLNNVLLLDFTFETAQSAFQGFSVLDMDFCQNRLTCLLR
jgi:hypothetical protein